jgi:hypothetical protein
MLTLDQPDLITDYLRVNVKLVRHSLDPYSMDNLGKGITSCNTVSECLLNFVALDWLIAVAAESKHFFNSIEFLMTLTSNFL